MSLLQVDGLYRRFGGVEALREDVQDARMGMD